MHEQKRFFNIFKIQRFPRNCKKNMIPRIFLTSAESLIPEIKDDSWEMPRCRKINRTIEILRANVDHAGPLPRPSRSSPTWLLPKTNYILSQHNRYHSEQAEYTNDYKYHIKTCQFSFSIIPAVCYTLSHKKYPFLRVKGGNLCVCVFSKAQRRCFFFFIFHFCFFGHGSSF